MQEAKIEASSSYKTCNIPVRQTRRHPHTKTIAPGKAHDRNVCVQKKFKIKLNVSFLIYFIDHFKGVKFFDHFVIIRMMKINS
jgi:hypothetical protein